MDNSMGVMGPNSEFCGAGTDHTELTEWPVEAPVQNAIWVMSSRIGQGSETEVVSAL